MRTRNVSIFVLLVLFGSAFADTSLSDAYSGAIGAAWSSGRFQTLYQTWFGAAPRPNPPCLKFFPEQVPRHSSLNKILQRGVVKVGLGLLNAPYSYIENGQLKGFDVELAFLLTDIVATKYNRSLTVQHVLVDDFSVQLPLGVQRGDFDVIISDFSITAERQQLIDFTCSYVPAEIRILRSSLDPERVFNSVADLNQPTVKFVLFSGTLLEGLTRRFFPNAQFVQISDPSKAVALADVLVAIEENAGHVTVLPEALITYFLAHPNNCTGCSLLDIAFVPPLYKGIGTKSSPVCPGNSGGNGNGNHKRFAFN